MGNGIRSKKHLWDVTNQAEALLESQPTNRGPTGPSTYEDVTGQYPNEIHKLVNRHILFIMSDTYRSVVLAKRPKSTIVPGETFTIKTKKSPTKADLKDGQVIFQAWYLSLDPAMRGWLNGKLYHWRLLIQ